MNIENLDKSLISFELSDEDVQAIRGGSTADSSVTSSSRIFPIVIVAVPPHKYPWVIIIKAPPINNLS